MSGKKTFEQHIPHVVERLNKQGFTCNIERTQYPMHATELAKKVSYDRVDLLVVSGGDGTMNEIVNGIAETSYKPTIGYIPSGTSCDLAKTLGIPKNIDKALKIIETGIKVSMDIGHSSHGHFNYVTALGNYVDISYITHSKLKKIFGYFAYILVGVKQFFTIPMIKAKIITSDKTFEGYYSLMIILNSSRVASFKLVKNPVLDDGKIDVILYPYIPLLNNVIYALSFIFRIKKIPFVKRMTTQEIMVLTTHPKKWNIDGEAADAGNQIITVKNQRVNMIIDESKLGLFQHQKQGNYNE